MIREPRGPLLDLIICLSDAMDLVCPADVDHRKQVAYITFSLAAELGLPGKQQHEPLLARGLHYVGALSARDRLNTLRFDIKKSHEHTQLGYLLLRLFTSLAPVAPLVGFRHVPWNHRVGTEFKG
ncbi:MAG: hypothetical protein EPO21_07605 [Chloroflexota bacterium]|nr:MAG: hypothetical protein EPO21_07605 [Chloroflexota bacterium]